MLMNYQPIFPNNIFRWYLMQSLSLHNSLKFIDINCNKITINDIQMQSCFYAAQYGNGKTYEWNIIKMIEILIYLVGKN